MPNPEEVTAAIETLKLENKSHDAAVRALQKEVALLKSRKRLEWHKHWLIIKILGVTGFGIFSLSVIIIVKPLTWLQICGLGGLLILWLCVVAVAILSGGKARG